MKKLIITDLHGRNPRGLIEQKERFEGVEGIVCLGDVESPEITEYLLKLNEEKTIIVPGNHDFPYIVDCCRLLREKEVDRNKKPDYLSCGPYEYWRDVEKWVKSPELGGYAMKIVGDFENDERFQKEFGVNAGKVVCVHASLPSETDPKEGPAQLWARMYHPAMGYFSSAITENFEMMKDPYVDIWMLLRGHDIGQRVLSMDRKSASFANYEVNCDSKSGMHKLQLSGENCYIASCGSYKDGQYAIFDEDRMVLELHNPGRK